MGKNDSAPSVRPRIELQGTAAKKIGGSITGINPEMDHFCTHPSG